MLALTNMTFLILTLSFLSPSHYRLHNPQNNPFSANTMQILSTTLAVMSLMSAATASTIVRWTGCGSEYQQTISDGDSCTAISGFKNTNLCSVNIPGPGKNRCEFYTTTCGNPFGDTMYCKVGETCDTRGWPALDSYRCYDE